MANSSFSQPQIADPQKYSAGKNKIINPRMDIWQRGTSFAAIANGAYCADRFVWSVAGAAAHTISRSADVPTVAQAGTLFNYSLLIDCTTADASIAATDLSLLSQRVEGYNWAHLAQRPFTLSFWVKATKTGIYCVSFRNSNGDRSYVAEYTVNSADTWEYKTITVSPSPSAGTWDYTTGIGLYVGWALAMGSTYHTTAGTWQTGNYLATANQVNATDSTSNNFYITGIQLEEGINATSLEQRHFGHELMLCQRYCEKNIPYATTPADGVANNGIRYTGITYTTNSIALTIPFVVPKRVAPSAATLYRSDLNGTGNGQWDWYDGAAWTDGSSTAFSSACEHSIVLSMTATGAVGGHTYLVGGVLLVSVEL